MAKGLLAVISCQTVGNVYSDFACTDRFRLPLERQGDGWREVNSFDRLEEDDDEARLVMVRLAAAVISNGHLVHASGGIRTITGITVQQLSHGGLIRQSLGLPLAPMGRRWSLGQEESEGLDLWDVATGEELWSVDMEDMRGLAFSPNGQSITAAI